jgi:hypothetical protein
MSRNGRGQLTPDEIAARCARLGAAVEQHGHRWRILPPDRTKGPVFVSALYLGRGSALGNTLRDLRRAGLDIESPEALDKAAGRPKAKAVGAQPAPGQTGSGAVTTTDEPLDVTVTDSQIPSPAELAKRLEPVSELRRQLAELREQTKAQGDTILELVDRVASLEARPPVYSGTRPRQPNPTEITRKLILEFLTQHRGMKFSPMIVHANLEGMPGSMTRANLGLIMRELAKDGVIKGGGAREDINNPNMNHGLYWMEAEPETKSAGKST